MQQAHPLFPARSEDEDPPEVHSIHVVRLGEGWHAKPFPPDELTSLEDVFHLFGGGSYELIARNDRHVTDRQRYTIPGPSKPLNDGAGAPGAPPAPANGGAPATPQMMMQAGSDPSILLAIMKMMSDQSNNTTQLLVAMMNSGREQQAAHIENMQRLHHQHSESQAQMYRALVDSSNRGGGGEMYAQAFRQALDLTERIQERYEAGDGEEPDELAQIASDLSPILQQVLAAQQNAAARAKPPNGAGPPMAPPDGPPTTIHPDELAADEHQQ